MARMRLAFLLPCVVSCCWCQTPSDYTRPADAVVYEVFFRQLASLSRISKNATIEARAAGGRVITLTVPKLQSVIGLTDSEADAVFTAAAECVRQMESLDNTMRPVILEARFQQMESGEAREPVAQQLKAYEKLHTQLVIMRVQELRKTLGDTRFAVLDQYVLRPGRNPRDLEPSQPAAIK
jgi:hypothetical protein